MRSTDTCVQLALQRAAATRARRARRAHAMGASIGCLVLAALLLTPMATSFHGADGLSTQGLFGASLFGDEAGSYVRTNDDEDAGTYEDVLGATYIENRNYDVSVVKGDFVIVAAYTVRFDANVPANASTTCSGSMDDQGFAADEKKALSANGYTLPGYDFAGWNTEADGTGTTYADGAEVENLADAGGTVTLFAQWSAKAYEVVFNPGKIGGDEYRQTARFDQPGTLEAYSDEAFGWGSGGMWDVEPRGATISAASTFTYTFDAEQEVYGVVEWDDDDNESGERPEKVTVRLMVNGAESRTMEVAEGAYGLWAFSFDKLPPRDPQGNEIAYSVTADNVPGYSVEVVHVDGNAYRITYTRPTPIKPTLTVTAKDQDYTYNGQTQGEGDTAYEDPAQIAEKVTVEGLLEGDELTSVVLDGQGQEVGEYPIEVTGFSIDNNPGARDKYDVVLVPGKLAIDPAKATIAVNSASKVAGEADPVFTGTVEGLVHEGDLGEVRYVRTNDDEAPGTYAGVLTATYDENPNYDVGVAKGDFTIAKPIAYSVTAVGGTADKTTAVAGETVTITADAPEPGKAFVQWTQVDGVDFNNASSTSTTFVMPAKNVAVTAVTAPIIIGSIGNKIYTSSAIEPADEVRVSLEGDDYEVSFADNVDAGDAKVTVTMKSPRAGSATSTFKIAPADISEASVTADDQKYDGAEHKPAPTVTWNGRTLVASKDYEVSSYADNVHAGCATVTVAGKGNFAGEASGTFGIAKRPATITVNCASKVQGEIDPDFFGTVEGLVASGDLGEVGYVRTNDDEVPGVYEGVLTAVYVANNDYDVSVSKGDFTIKALLTLRWLDGDGSVLASKDYGEGDEPPVYDGRDPSKAATAQYTYAFTNWDGGTVEGAVTTYRPLFSETINEYTVKFVNDDGTELQGGKVAYGEMPEYKGATPEKAATTQYTYAFKGWSPKVVAVTGDATYTATYDETVNKYQVTFVDYDGSTALGEATAYDYGTPAAEVKRPADPERAADAQHTYKFTGWTPEVADVTADAVYTAVYESSKRSYEITWLQDDGTPIDKTTVGYGEKPVHADPAKVATAQYTYTFSGWSPEVVAVTGDATYTATYDEVPIVATLTFDLASGTIDGKVGPITIEANVGDVVKLPAAPTREGYAFKYWRGSQYAAGAEYTVEGDHTFTAVWEREVEPVTETFTVTFDANGHGAAPAVQEVESGKAAMRPADPTADGWAFGGWYTDKSCTQTYDFSKPVSGDVTLYAKWTKKVSPTPSPDKPEPADPVSPRPSIPQTGDPFAGMLACVTGLALASGFCLVLAGVGLRRRIGTHRS